MNWPRRKHNLVRMGTCKWADKYCGRSHDVYPRGRVPMADTTQCHNAGNNNNGVWFKWKRGGSNNTDGVCRNTSKKPCNDHRHHMQGEKWGRWNDLAQCTWAHTQRQMLTGGTPQWCIYKGSCTRADTTQCHNAGNNNNGVWSKWKRGQSNNTMSEHPRWSLDQDCVEWSMSTR